MESGRLAATFLACICFCSLPASAQCLAHEIARITSSDSTEADHFGTSSYVVGDLVVVGANKAGDLANSGAAYVFRLSQTLGWIEEQRLIPEDAEAQDDFGLSVAINPIDPNLIIVGAWADDDACPENVWCQSGSAYIFRYDPDTSGWFQEQKLTPADADIQDYFGWSVSMWDDVAVVGARLDDDPVAQTGSAYVFRRDPGSGIWVEQQKLIPPVIGRFGTSVSLQGDVMLIGAPVDSEIGFQGGAVYVFRFNVKMQTWQQEQKLIPSEFEGAGFGWSVSIDGDTALIGTPADGPNAGAAYIFTYNGQQWTQQQKLTASDAGPSSWFGWSVSLKNGKAVIGANISETMGKGYLFTFDGEQWTEKARLRAQEIEGVYTFGSSVSTDGEHALIGANFSTVNGDNEAGAAFIFGGLGDCNNNGIIDICDIADGTATDKNNNGLPDECDQPPCPWDMDNSGSVGVGDLLMMFAQWGTPGPADFNADGIVNTADLLILLANWGPC